MNKAKALALALIMALISGCPLTDNGIDPASTGDIHAAAGSGDVEKVKVILEADPSRAEALDLDGNSPLDLATGNGHMAVVWILLEYDVAPDSTDKDGVTALVRAAAGGHRDVVDLLLKKGANPNTA